MLEVCLFVLGIVIGFVIAYILRCVRTVGDLCVDDTETGSVPYLALKNSADFEVIKREKFIQLKVVTIRNNSQK